MVDTEFLLKEWILPDSSVPQWERGMEWLDVDPGRNKNCEVTKHDLIGTVFNISCRSAEKP
jgi:hypothetical protein